MLLIGVVKLALTLSEKTVRLPIVLAVTKAELAAAHATSPHIGTPSTETQLDNSNPSSSTLSTKSLINPALTPKRAHSASSS